MKYAVIKKCALSIMAIGSSLNAGQDFKKSHFYSSNSSNSSYNLMLKSNNQFPNYNQNKELLNAEYKNRPLYNVIPENITIIKDNKIIEVENFYEIIHDYANISLNCDREYVILKRNGSYYLNNIFYIKNINFCSKSGNKFYTLSVKNDSYKAIYYGLIYAKDNNNANLNIGNKSLSISVPNKQKEYTNAIEENTKFHQELNVLKEKITALEVSAIKSQEKNTKLETEIVKIVTKHDKLVVEYGNLALKYEGLRKRIIKLFVKNNETFKNIFEKEEQLTELWKQIREIKEQITPPEIYDNSESSSEFNGSQNSYSDFVNAENI